MAKIIVTVPAETTARYRDLATHNAVEGFRINTNLTPTSPIEHILENAKFESAGKPLWVDLKCRQLRIADYEVQILPTEEIHRIKLSHDIELNTPVDFYVDNGQYLGRAFSLENKNTLVSRSSSRTGQGLPLPSQDGRGIRPGMSININDPSLVVKGFLTQKDEMYIDAAKKAGIHDYMLSFVESQKDIDDLLALDKDARIVAKIESQKGLDFVDNDYQNANKQAGGKINLLTARGDLYTELNMVDQIIDASEKMIRADKDAIFASRILESLVNVDAVPRCSELFDVYAGLKMGYTRFLLGDEVCRGKTSVKAALGLFEIISDKTKVYK
jgi:hypothetical protein